RSCRSGRCAQLSNNTRQSPAHLLGCSLGRRVGPWHSETLSVFIGKSNLVVNGAYDICPYLEFLRRAQPGFCPEQVLLVESIAVLDAIPQSVGLRNLFERRHGRSVPNQPNDP